MRFGNIDELPDWLVAELNHRSAEPTLNTLIELLLEDYIQRKSTSQVSAQPPLCHHTWVKYSPGNPSSWSYCLSCGQQKV